MMTPLLRQHVGRFDGGGRHYWVWRGRLQGELVVVLPVYRIPVSICCAKRRATSFARVLEGDKPVHHFPRFRPHVFLRTERFVVDVEGVRFRPRAFVVGRGVVAVCMRISSQEYVYDK